MRLGRTRLAAGDRTGAVEAFTRLYEVYPLSDLAQTAAAQLTDLAAWAPLERGSVRYGKELKRAERLFAARRYAQARDAFEALLPVATSDDYELVSLRLAECDHYLKRYDAARTALLPWLDRASRRAEARFFHLTATRELGEHAEYVRLADALATEFPADSWSEEALNNLATHYILDDDDASADAAFRRLARQFPTGRHAPARGLEDRMERVPAGPACRMRGDLRKRRERISAIGLPSAVDLLVGPLARPARRCPHRQSPLRHPRRRLPELVLRPHRGARADLAPGGADDDGRQRRGAGRRPGRRPRGVERRGPCRRRTRP